MRSAHFKKILAWLLVLGTSASLAACGTGSDGAKKGIVISEVVSSNGKSYEHDYYGSPDWIELHNESDQPDRKSTRLNSSHPTTSRMPSSA